MTFNLLFEMTFRVFISLFAFQFISLPYWVLDRAGAVVKSHGIIVAVSGMSAHSCIAKRYFWILMFFSGQSRITA